MIGCGLIGASFARAVKKLGSTVTGCGRSEANLRAALDAGYVDAISASPSDAVKGVDLVMLASPVDTFFNVAEAMAPSLSPGTVVIDAGSVKGAVVDKIEARMPEGVHFVGCHPIAGSEFSGAMASRDGLFKGAVCVITPTPRTDAAALRRVVDLWRAIGSRVEEMDPAAHDRIFALVSHFPHMAAYAIMNTLDAMEPGCIAYSGGGLTDTTRIAMSPPLLWRSICGMNRDNLLRILGVFSEQIGRMRDALQRNDLDGLEAEFRRAALLREKV